MPMRVLIVDDHPIVASGCRALLAGEPEIVILEASDAESGERAFVAEHPDICVLDINLPTVSGFELARRILAHIASARIIAFAGPSLTQNPLSKLTSREIEILRLLSAGKSLSEIAWLVHSSYKTIANTSSIMRQKLGVRTSAELVRLAIESSLT